LFALLNFGSTDFARRHCDEVVMKRIFFELGLLLIFSVFAPHRDVRSEDFYKDKTIRLVVGTSPGGAMDDWARFLAPHLSRNIPGSPDIVVQNMPGAGTTIAANHIYSIANPDGLTLGSALGSEGSPIRLAEVFLDRFSGACRSSSVHARRHSLQEH
jgi:tripartite-type tricarboxylate transporter receptor subunit TctC